MQCFFTLFVFIKSSFNCGLFKFLDVMQLVAFLLCSFPSHMTLQKKTLWTQLRGNLDKEYIKNDPYK